MEAACLECVDNCMFVDWSSVVEAKVTSSFVSDEDCGRCLAGHLDRPAHAHLLGEKNELEPQSVQKNSVEAIRTEITRR